MLCCVACSICEGPQRDAASGQDCCTWRALQIGLGFLFVWRTFLLQRSLCATGIGLPSDFSHLEHIFRKGMLCASEVYLFIF